MKWYFWIFIALLPLIVAFAINYYSEKKCERDCNLNNDCLDKCHDKFARKI